MFGTIVLFKPDKGYGFIRQASGEDIFFHVSHFPPGTEPRVGLSVEFRTGIRQGKPIAIDIKPIGEASDNGSPPGESASASQRAVRAVLGGAS